MTTAETKTPFTKSKTFAIYTDQDEMVDVVCPSDCRELETRLNAEIARHAETRRVADMLAHELHRLRDTVCEEDVISTACVVAEYERITKPPATAPDSGKDQPD